MDDFLFVLKKGGQRGDFFRYEQKFLVSIKDNKNKNKIEFQL